MSVTATLPAISFNANFSIDEITAFFEQRCPELWRRNYTKHIEVPGNYRGFKAIAATFTSAEVECRFYAGQKRLVSNGGLIGQELLKYDWPCYLVTKPLLDALSHTHPPKGMTWEEVVFPFPAVMFMIPRGTLRDCTGLEIYALGACSIGASDPESFNKLPQWMKEQGGHNYPRICVFWLFEPAGINLHDCTFPQSQLLEPDPDWINKATAQQMEQYNRPDPVATGEFASQMAAIVANLLLLMQARPELIEYGEKTTRKLPKFGIPIVRPTFLGRKYAVKSETSASVPVGHFTELRWRAGHMKRQHFGKGNEQVKTIFIEPYVCYGAGLAQEVEA